ncbi:hypothetical protein COU20_01770 [Candidatus Kaiserbacteria bacterium CG10_big_fil_rev_8_21_14_0_10_59_10]|uniref:LTD domain-containing protein n=1 Tax=Candidatus Kaiserbacteria bacterium CG10_big_fil_rev_8_21_14_0_10_59_10 TaxID=1974612 RepID=A0A2H0U7X4_9BACT|nr:MAG: hypothetical protein COU20_01770 [Candidatus Kaiserbacteria bacterium CG10_big_fil_rev_8_21_14_0_10_59_10]
MLKYIFLGIVAFLIVGMLALWFLQGGMQRTRDALLDDRSALPIFLPWFIQAPVGVDFDSVYGISEEGDSPAYAASADAQADYRAIQDQYERLMQEAQNVRSFGDPSPHYGSVRISADSIGPREANAEAEYVVFAASSQNSAPIDLTGWSLHSALSGVRLFLPRASSPFVQGSVNTVEAVRLAPGERVVAQTGLSPVGVSFKENMCIGYLEQYQDFSPPLLLSCPTPSSEVPFNAHNLQAYGEACFSALRTISTCHFPASLPSDISAACRAHLQSTLSYNGCLNRHSRSQGFAGDTWRLFLGSSDEAWRNTHDIIRLLDADGRTVDVFTY